MDFLTRTSGVILLSLNMLALWGHGQVSAGFTNVQTTNGSDYLVPNSNYTTDFSSASTACLAEGVVIASFTTNTDFQDMADALKLEGGYTGFKLWASVTKVGSTYYFTGGEEIAADKWANGEPNESCSGTCCYFIDYSNSDNEFRLADNKCTNAYSFLCRNTSSTVNTTTPTTAATIETTTGVVPSAPTTPALALSTGQQMTVMYLGLIIATSLLISCVCSACWVLINRLRRRRRAKMGGSKEQLEKDRDDNGHSDSSDPEDD